MEMMLPVAGRLTESFKPVSVEHFKESKAGKGDEILLTATATDGEYETEKQLSRQYRTLPLLGKKTQAVQEHCWSLR